MTRNYSKHAHNPRVELDYCHGLMVRIATFESSSSEPDVE